MPGLIFSLALTQVLHNPYLPLLQKLVLNILDILAVLQKQPFQSRAASTPFGMFPGILTLAFRQRLMLYDGKSLQLLSRYISRMKYQLH